MHPRRERVGLIYLLIWGAAAFGFYTLSLIGQHLIGVRLVAATAVFGVAWGIEALAGPWATGFLVDAFGPLMLPMTVALIYELLTVAALVIRPIRQSSRQRERLSESAEPGTRVA